MQTANWILAAATSVLALTSLVAVITWRENRRRDREEQQTTRILDAARKEFSTKDDLAGARGELAGLKSTLTGIGILGAAAVLIAMWDRLTTISGRDGNRET